MNDSDFDLVCYSDGSGHVDGFGGWAALCETPDKVWCIFRSAAINGISVERAEFSGLLEGLQMAMELSKQLPQYVPGWKPRVMLFTDRENLVLSIKGVYDCGTDKDLWNRYRYYESILDIAVTHLDRESKIAAFKLCDREASTCRIIAKQYAQANNFPPYRLTFE